MPYQTRADRYDSMKYNRCGRSGVMLPAISLGIWFNFGGVDSYSNSKAMILKAFDLGICHFDGANNYGPPVGSAEETLAKVLKDELFGHRDELIISTKAGWPMWQGPYGDFGSRKHLTASIDQSLKRLGVDYVDIFYHHRPDPETPLEETMMALDSFVKQGKALYVGLSNRYEASSIAKAAKILKELGTPLLIHQPPYNMLNRSIEESILPTLEENGVGCIVFSPLAGGLLTNRYLNGIPEGSRATKEWTYLSPERINEEMVKSLRKLNEIAQSRGQSLAQMSLAWVLKDKRVTSAIIGASRVEQIEDNVKTINNLEFSEEELKAIVEAIDLS